MNDGSVAVSRARIRTIRKGYAVGDILDEARISVTWAEGRAKRTTTPILSLVTYYTGQQHRRQCHSCVSRSSFAPRGAQTRQGAAVGGKLEEARVPRRERRRAVINLGRYSCTRTNENRGRDRDEF